MSKVEFRLESPLMVGGKRLKDNVLQSLDYIPGHVIRAAFVKYILLNCPLYIPGEQNEKGLYNFIAVKDEDKCCSCRLYSACKNFSWVRFSFFYPKGYEILPLTAKVCKNKPDEHGIKDLLTRRGDFKCDKCIGSNNKNRNEWEGLGRMEAAKGYSVNGKRILPSRISFIRTAIDSYTQTALDGSLYSVDAVRQGITFTGEIDGLELLNIEEGQTFYVGRYTSVGLGRMKLQKIQKCKADKNLLVLLQKFNLRMEGKTKEPSKNYIPIMLKSDAKLGFEKKDEFELPLCTEDYREEWKRMLLGEEEKDLAVEQVYNEYDIYRGYDTSREWGKWEKEPEIYTLKGTTILLSTESPLELILPKLQELETKGIGSDTLNGFGEVEICSKLHVEGEI